MLVLDDHVAQHQSDHGDGDLEQKAPPPAYGVGDGTAERGSTNGTEASYSVLERLVH